MTSMDANQTGTRIQALDALRGFALCGIIFINIPQTMDMLPSVARAPEGLRLFVLGRFYPIFYLLFGVGFGIFLRSAARRTTKPRLLLLRRLLALAVFGALHHLLQPGEVLLPFAIAGLLVLLPLSYAPARVNLVAGAVLTVAGVLIAVGGFGILPGLFVLGFALAQLRVPETLPGRPARLATAAFAFAAVALLAYLLISWGVPDLTGRWLGLTFSMAMAAGYAAGFLALLHTAAGPALSGLLAPMGRLALTNYLTATLLFVPLGAVLGLRGSTDFATAALLGAVILLAQAVWSPLWLRWFDYGPLEWVWRTITYWRPIPIRRTPEAAALGAR